MNAIFRRVYRAVRVLFGPSEEPDLTSIRKRPVHLSQEARESLVEQLASAMAHKLMTTPTFVGDPGRVHVGESVSLVNTLFNISSGDVFIGDYVFFGHNVHVLTGTHVIDRFDYDRMIEIPQSGRDVVIEQGAWIATNASVIGPCRIGRDAVIGVGSVVTGDVRAGWFYAGCPARPIKPVAPKYADAT